jgi:hypothetical protein
MTNSVGLPRLSVTLPPTIPTEHNLSSTIEVAVPEAHPLLLQFVSTGGMPQCGLLQGDLVRIIADYRSTYDLVQAAASAGMPLAAFAAQCTLLEGETFRSVADSGRLLPPITHPAPAHCLITGTGLTHLGSMEPRDAMHQTEAAKESDSARMYRWGLEGGRPAEGSSGVSPEWFYKGDGSILVPPGGDLPSPAFAERGGEEFEIAMIYYIDADGTPLRIGCALGNEFSDHILESRNYLYLAHSKLRPCSIGPVLRLGSLPDEVLGEARIRRDASTVWQRPFITGAARMSHSLENLEFHHFKYRAFRRPGDIHIHFLGAAVLSWSDGFETAPGDLFELEAEGFGPALSNRLASSDDHFSFNQVLQA